VPVPSAEVFQLLNIYPGFDGTGGTENVELNAAEVDDGGVPETTPSEYETV
jgi:hypothetical protein